MHEIYGSLNFHNLGHISKMQYGEIVVVERDIKPEQTNKQNLKQGSGILGRNLFCYKVQ